MVLPDLDRSDVGSGHAGDGADVDDRRLSKDCSNAPASVPGSHSSIHINASRRILCRPSLLSGELVGVGVDLGGLLSRGNGVECDRLYRPSRRCSVGFDDYHVDIIRRGPDTLIGYLVGQ